MEDNEMKEVIDETIDESQKEVNEVEETTDEPNSDDDSTVPTLEDYEALKKKAETLQAQKEHWRKKAELSKNNTVVNKSNNTEVSDEEKLLKMAKLATTLDEDDFEVLKSLNGSSYEEKINSPLFKAYKEDKERKAKSKEAALKPSSPGRTFSKNDPNEPGITPEEREARIKKEMGL